ncbi:MAG: hypothetical protein AAGI08_06770 [Bacteroidota bacterium]
MKLILVLAALAGAGVAVWSFWPRASAGLPEQKTDTVPSSEAAVQVEGEERTGSLGASEKIRAVTLDAWHKPPEGTLADLASHGVSHIALVTFGWQEAYNTPRIRMKTDARWYTESDRGIAELAERGRAHGIRVIVKPHLWLSNSAAEEFYQGKKVITKKWRDGIEFQSESDWQTWEADYRRFMLHYADLAQEIRADILCVGTELRSTVANRPAYWRGLIAEIRERFDGRLTYAANWYKGYQEVPFWDALDIVGVQAYFPLSNDESPSADTLIAGWQRHKEALETLQREAGKPLMFTELGYRSVPFAASEPWTWPSRADRGSVRPDLQLQADLYEAFFQAFWSEPWFAGSIIWKWYPEGAHDDERRAIDFTPQDKPAAEVLRQYYAGT